MDIGLEVHVDRIVLLCHFLQVKLPRNDDVFNPRL
jgi:hypothetical protein